MPDATQTQPAQKSPVYAWLGDTADTTMAKPVRVTGPGTRSGCVNIAVDEPDGWVGQIAASALYDTAEACTEDNERPHPSPQFTPDDVGNIREAVRLLTRIAAAHGQVSEEQQAQIAELLS